MKKLLGTAFAALCISAVVCSQAVAQTSVKDSVIESLTITFQDEFSGASTIEDFSKIYGENPDNMEIRYLAYISALQLMIDSPSMDSFKAFNLGFPEQPRDLIEEVTDFDDLFHGGVYGTGFVEGPGEFYEGYFHLLGPGRTVIDLSKGVLVTGIFEPTVYDPYADIDDPTYFDQNPEQLSETGVTGEAFIFIADVDDGGYPAYCICQRMKVDDKWDGYEGTMHFDGSQFIGRFDDYGSPEGKGILVNKDGTRESVDW